MWRSHSHRKPSGGGKGPLSSTNREGQTAKQVSMENDQNNPTYLKCRDCRQGTQYLCREKRREKICTPYLEAVTDSSLECRLTVLVIEVPQGMRGGITERSDTRHLTVKANADIKTRASNPRLAAKWGKKPKQHSLGARSYNCNLFPNARGRSESRQWPQLIIFEQLPGINI